GGSHASDGAWSVPVAGVGRPGGVPHGADVGFPCGPCPFRAGLGRPSAPGASRGPCPGRSGLGVPVHARGERGRRGRGGRAGPACVCRAGPARSRQAWGDRLPLGRPGVRVLGGPASACPYTRAGSGGDGAGGGGRGRYQLFTRIMVENTGTAPLDVIWSGAYLEAEDGERIALVESRQIGPEA